MLRSPVIHESTNFPVFVALRRLPEKSLLFRIVFLGGTVLIASAVVLPVGWAISGNPAGLLAGAAAGGVCLLAAGTALTVSEPLRTPRYMLTLVHVGMMIRMGIPLAAALAVYFRGGPLAEGGFLYYLIVFYPVTLAVETFLALSGPREKNVPSAHDFAG